MKVGVLCEESGTVRNEFIKLGHDAVSCDILPRPGPHLRGDCLSFDWSGYDLLVCFPPCTHLCSSGAGHMAKKRADGRQAKAVQFVKDLSALPVERIAIENPVGVLSTLWRKPDQIVQPFHFGHAETKTTCLWLKGLPPLEHTNIVEPDYMRKPNGDYYLDAKGKRYSRVHFLSGRSPDRARIRSKTYTGIARAMASQWGGLVASSPSPREGRA